jgi:hypothetical protein
LIVRGLKWSRIDLRQEVARLDVLALGESDLGQFAIDPSLYRDSVERLNSAQASEIDGDIAPPRRGDRYRDRRRRPSCCRHGDFSCRMMLPANVTARRGNQNCQASEQEAVPADRFLERF